MNNTPVPHRIAADFTFYLDKGFILIRPETVRAERHLKRNVSQYNKWLFRFYFGDGSSIVFARSPGGGTYLKPKADWASLGEALVNRGFIVVRDDKENPPWTRLVIGHKESPWLLQLNNCRIPTELSKMIIRGAGKPN